MSKLIAIGLAASAAALSLKNDPALPVHLIADASCTWSGAAPVTALVLAEDISLDDEQKTDPKTTTKKEAQAGRMKVYQDALVVYKEKKKAFMLAQSKLMLSMEGLLETPAADPAVLAKAAGGTLGKDALVAFYAPWCPHCQTFVLHDKKGNPTNAPLENLRKDMAKDQKLKGVAVYRADVTKLGQQGIPAKLPVKGIPTMYFINAKGVPTQFAGNPHDTESIKAFANGLVSK